MEPAKILIIFYLLPPVKVKQLRNTLGHTGYYRNFIWGYDEVMAPMENLSKKNVKFQWNEQCQESLDILKYNMVLEPILVFPDWKKEFNVHVDVLSVALGVLLAHPGEGAIDHPIAFASRKLSTT